VCLEPLERGSSLQQWHYDHSTKYIVTKADPTLALAVTAVHTNTPALQTLAISQVKPNHFFFFAWSFR
jgi:hypothetical protein